MKTTAPRLAALAGAATLALVLGAGPAAAHVGTSQDAVPAGSTIALGLTVGHGCGDSPTDSMTIQIPAGVNAAMPFAHPGWTVTSEREALSPPVTTAHGQEITERVSVISFTAAAGNALPVDVRDTFVINVTAPDRPGDTLFFKTVQGCVTGSNDWIEEWDGTGTEPDHPAPSIEVTAAVAGDDHHEGAADGTAVDEALGGGTDGDGDGTGLAVVGIVVGALGLLAGGAALARSRRVS